MKELKEYIRSIPDFPEKGIMFRDVTSVLQDADALKLSIDELAKRLEGVDFDVIAGAESRGFIFGAPLAYVMHKPFVPIRKKGKLPCETVEKTYDLEYGTATIEMHGNISAVFVRFQHHTLRSEHPFSCLFRCPMHLQLPPGVTSVRCPRTASRPEHTFSPQPDIAPA